MIEKECLCVCEFIIKLVCLNSYLILHRFRIYSSYTEEYHIHLQVISDIQMTHYRLDINVILFDNIYFVNSSLNSCSCIVAFQEKDQK